MDKKQQVLHNFTYHPPKHEQQIKYEKLREAAKHLALLILDETPESREQSLALTELEKAIMFANAAIARNT